MGESRSELIAWLNELLQPSPSITKIEDNLEFCQWIKRFWDANTPGIEYDAVGRRGGQASGARGQTPTASSSAAARTTASRTAVRTSAASSNDRPPSTSTSATRRPLAGSAGAVPAGRIGYAAARPSAGSANQEAINALTEQMSEMRVSVEALEKERDFYFGKLRDIEVIIAERLEDGSSESTADTDILKRIQGILYQTEEGFEVPDLDGEVAENGLLDEEETF
ncbi:microtubule integrity protein mal3 [Cystobasidiomycetes sp. EMM_F5]